MSLFLLLDAYVPSVRLLHVRIGWLLPLLTQGGLPPPPQLLYTLRFALKGRVQPATQHRIFLGATAAALAHAGYILTDTTT